MSYQEWLPLDSRKRRPSTIAASLDKRFLAGLFDLAVTISFLVITEILITHLKPAKPDLTFYTLSLFFLFYYYIWSIYKTGKTQGKKYFALKLVYQLDPDRLRLGTVLFRELILKPVSIFSLGYLFWKFDSEGNPISFQDHYSDTRVITDAPAPDEIVYQYHPGLLVYFVWLLPVFIIYSLIFVVTPVPIYKIKSELNTQGINTLDFSGNALKGFKIKSLQSTFRNSFINLEEISFRVDIYELILHQKLIINSMKVKQLNISSTGVLRSTKAVPPTQQEVIAAMILPDTIEIRDIQFADFYIHGKSGNNLRIQNLQREIKNEIRIKRLLAETEYYLFDLNDISFNENNLMTNIPSSNVTAKKLLHQRLLQDFSFNLSAEFNIDRPEMANFTVTASNGDLRLHQTEKSFIVHINNIDPRKYLRLEWPINSISAEFYDNKRFTYYLENPNTIFTQTAEVQLHGRRFSLAQKSNAKNRFLTSTDLSSNTCEISLCLNYPDRSFVMNFNLNFLFNNNNEDDNQVLKIEESSRKHSYHTKKDLLAQVYFNKNYNQLADTEKGAVNQEVHLFEINPSRVADSSYLSEIKNLNYNPSSKNLAVQKGQLILQNLKKDRSALNIYKAIAYLRSIEACDSVLALPSTIFTDLMIQQPGLKAQINTTLGACYKDPAISLKFLNAAAESNPRDSEITYYRALNYYKLSNNSQTLSMLNFFFQIENQSSSPFYLLALQLQGRTYIRAKNYNAALATLQRLSQYRSSEVDLDQMVHLYRKMGNKSAALNVGRKLRAKIKNSPELKRNVSSETKKFLNL